MKNTRKKRSKNASEKDKHNAIRLLQKNSFDISKTSKILGISYNTLYIWKKEIDSNENINITNQEQLKGNALHSSVKLQNSIKEMQKQFVSDAQEVKELALLILRERLGSETNVKDILNAIKVLDDVMPEVPDNSSEQKDPHMSKWLEYIYNSNNKTV